MLVNNKPYFIGKAPKNLQTPIDWRNKNNQIHPKQPPK